MIAAGDVVIVHHEHLPRGQWKLGVVQEVLTGRDGVSRAAIVKVAANDQQQSTSRRPIQLLYPLEIHSDIYTTSSFEDTLLQPDVPETGSEQMGDVSTQTRPKRDASKKAMKVMRGWIAELEGDD